MPDLELLALTPPDNCDPGVAIAACRAGALGVLDLELTCDAAAAVSAVQTLARYAPAPFGVKLGRQCGAILAALLAECPPRPAWVIFAGGEQPKLPQHIEACRRALPRKPALALLLRLEAAGDEPDTSLARRAGMKLNTFLQNFGRARKLLAACLAARGIEVGAR